MPYIYTEADASGDSPANPHEEARAASVARNFVGACHFKMTGSKRGFRPGTASGCMCACLYMHIIYCRMLFPGSLLACEDAHVGIPPDPDAANAAVAGLPLFSFESTVDATMCGGLCRSRRQQSKEGRAFYRLHRLYKICAAIRLACRPPRSDLPRSVPRLAE